MRWLRVVGILSAFVLLASSCGFFGGDETATEDPVTGEEDGGETGNTVSIADAELTVLSETDPVVVNGEALSAGQTLDAAPGDVVEVEPGGSALITAASVFEIEALRGAKVTIPDLTESTLDVGLEVGHIFVRLDADAGASLTVDAGERQFITRSPDAEFALCQAPDGASCLAVLRGEVEWFEDGVASETYGTGRASFAARGNVPEPPRCADQLAIGEMQRSLRGEDFSGTLADIVATWETCDADDGLAAVGSSLPSAARMEHVVVEDVVVGSPDVDEDGESLIAEREVDGGADFYIEPQTATNGEFRTWLVNTARDDADLWRRHAPQDWIDRAPGGAATQASFAEGTADNAVQGVTYDTATEFCAAQAKRLPTEIEWELAAREEILEDLADESQDWVSNWEDYGPGPEDVGDRQVLRGADAVLAADPYFRVFAVSDAEATAARQHARVRCAADEVAIGGQVFDTVLVQEDFNSLGWPQGTAEAFELDYHPENYHLDLTAEHAQGAVARSLAEPLTDGRIDVDLFIERNNTGSDTGKFRFGALLGTADDLHTFTLQPDNFAADRFTACLLSLGPELAAELDLPNTLTPDSGGVFGTVGVDPGHAAGVGHNGEDCSEADVSVEVMVPSIDAPVRLSMVLVSGSTELWVNDVLVETTDAFSAIDVYGFYSQLYHRPRSHIHYDDLIISN